MMTEDELVTSMLHAAYEADPPRTRDQMRAALRIAIPWAREQALKEAARACQMAGTIADGYDCHDIVFALIFTPPTTEKPHE